MSAARDGTKNGPSRRLKEREIVERLKEMTEAKMAACQYCEEVVGRERRPGRMMKAIDYELR